jgi:Zn-dependent protease
VTHPRPAWPRSWTRTILGVPVTLEPWFLVAVVVFGLLGGRTGWALLAWIVVATVSVLAHEAGHAAAFRAFGVQPRIVLSSLFGLTYGDRLPFAKDITVSLAGPLTGILIGLLALTASQLLGTGNDPGLVLGDIVWANLGWSLFNLLPVVPLDGGSIGARMLERAGRPYREALILSMVTAGLVIGGSIAAGLPSVALLIGWLAASNFEDLRRLGDDWLRYRLDRHGRELLAGDVDAAISGLEDAERAARSRAVAGATNAGLVFALLMADRWQEAEGVFARHPSPTSEGLLKCSIDARRGQLDPELVVALAECRAYVEAAGAARAILAGGLLDEVLRQAQELPRKEANRALLILQIGLHYIREYVEAIRVGELLHERQKKWEIVPFWIGLDHAALGRTDEAIRWLIVAAERGFAEMAELDDSRFDQLRGLPAFEEVRARIASNPEATIAPAGIPAGAAPSVGSHGLPGIRPVRPGREGPS